MYSYTILKRLLYHEHINDALCDISKLTYKNTYYSIIFYEINICIISHNFLRMVKIIHCTYFRVNSINYLYFDLKRYTSLNFYYYIDAEQCLFWFFGEHVFSAKKVCTCFHTQKPCCIVHNVYWLERFDETLYV